MSSFGSLSGAPLQFNTDFVAESGVCALYGSFQGNGATVSAQSTWRGSWFTVSRIAAGQYRVQLVGITPNPALVPVQSVGNGQPNGLLLEPEAYLTTEAVQTAPIAANSLNVQCSKFDSASNSFDIWLTTGAAGAAQTGADPTSAARVNFTLSWKVLANLP